jgi:hypothetical protein
LVRQRRTFFGVGGKLGSGSLHELAPKINKLFEIHGAQGSRKERNACDKIHIVFAPGQHHIGDLTEMILQTLVAVEKR